MVLRTLGTLAYPKRHILSANPLSPQFLSPTRRIDVVVDVSTVFLSNQAFFSNALEIQARHASVGVPGDGCGVPALCQTVPYIPEDFCLKFSLLFPVQPFLL